MLQKFCISNDDNEWYVECAENACDTGDAYKYTDDTQAEKVEKQPDIIKYNQLNGVFLQTTIQEENQITTVKALYRQHLLQVHKI